MGKKSKREDAEPLNDDILDLAWNRIINPDPSGAWLDDALKQSSGAAEPLKTALPAIKRLIASRASREDIGRLARLERYETCFGVLYAFDDPGLTAGMVKGLGKLFIGADKDGKESEFISALWENIGGADEASERFDAVESKPAGNRPFDDVDAAVHRLRQSGVSAKDLQRLTRWQRFDACCEFLRLVERAGFQDAEELIGLHESILGAEPSGKEARPGSWPLPAKTSTQPLLPADPTQPFLTLKSIEAFGFTPDGRGLIIAPKAGAYRIIDFPSGQERATLPVKGRLSGWHFPNDGKRIFVTAEPNQIFVCDTTTGKLLHHFKWPQKIRNLSLLAIPTTGEFLVTTVEANSSGGADSRRFRFDAASLTVGQEVAFLSDNVTTEQLEFSPDSRRLIAFFNTLAGNNVPPRYHLKAWTWPELKPAWTASRVPKGGNWALTCSNDGRFVAASSTGGEVVIVDTATGRQIASLTSGEESNGIAFAADNRHLAAGEHGTGRIRIWDFARQRVVRELGTGTGWCFGVCFSPDGKVLAAASHRLSLFWNVEALLSREP